MPTTMTTTTKTTTTTTTATTRTRKSSSKRQSAANVGTMQGKNYEKDGRGDKENRSDRKTKSRGRSRVGKGLFNKKSNNEIVNPRMAVDKRVVDELLLVCGVIGTTTLEPEEEEEAQDENQSRRILAPRKKKNLSAPSIVPVADCLNWLQDLQRALRRDDDTYRPISLLLGKWKVVSQKLFPLVMACRYDTPLVLTVVKILVILTKPLHEAALRASSIAAINVKDASLTPEVLAEQQKIRENAIGQSDQLMEYKRLFVHHPSHNRPHDVAPTHSHKTKAENGGLLSILVSLLAEPLSRTGTARTDSDHLTIELVLHLLRNLLSAEPLAGMEESARRRHDALHQDLISLLERELVLDILLVLGQDLEATENSAYNLLTMEILHYLLRSQDPTLVAKSVKTKPVPKGKVGATSSSSSSLLKERQNLQATATSRHALFGGTLVVMKPNGSRQYISASTLGLPPQAAATVTTGPTRRKHRQMEPFVVVSEPGAATTATTTMGCRHTRQPVLDHSPSRIRAQRALHSFCCKFLAKGYGPTMKSLKNEFRRESARLEHSDRPVFFRLVWFFCQWWRTAKEEGTLPKPKATATKSKSKKKESDSETEDEQEEEIVTDNGTVGHLIFTMDVFTFNLVLTSIDSYISHKKATDLAQTVALYCEMMHLLKAMHSSVDETEHVMSLGLLDRLFYSSEPLDRLSKLLSYWAPGINSREFLCDIVDIVHTTLKLLEKNGKMAVAAMEAEEEGGETRRTRKKKKKKDDEPSGDAVQRMNAAASDFDVPVYFARRTVSNQVVQMYTTLLAQYKVNAPRVNEEIVSFLVRLCKFVVSQADDLDDWEHDASSSRLRREPGGHESSAPLLLGNKTATLEPMLYNIQTIMVLNQILNDKSLSTPSSHSATNDTEALLSFATVIVRHYASAAKANPLLHVEALFRHAAPHRFCELLTNTYVTEELRMIYQRDLLLEEQRGETQDVLPRDNADEGEIEFVDEDDAQRTEKSGGQDKDETSDEELEETGNDDSGTRTSTIALNTSQRPKRMESSLENDENHHGEGPSSQLTLDTANPDPNDDETLSDQERWNDRRAFVPKRKRKGTVEEREDDKSRASPAREAPLGTTSKAPEMSKRNRRLALQDSDDDDDDTQMLLEQSNAEAPSATATSIVSRKRLRLSDAKDDLDGESILDGKVSNSDDNDPPTGTMDDERESQQDKDNDTGTLQDSPKAMPRKRIRRQNPDTTLVADDDDDDEAFGTDASNQFTASSRLVLDEDDGGEDDV